MSLFDIGLSHKVRIERHDGDGDIPVLNFLFVLTQLRQMFTTGQSPQMPMEHQQQPAAGIVFQTMSSPVDIRQRKLRSGLFKKPGHGHALTNDPND